MKKVKTYKIPNQFFFRLHHVRPRFKNDVEEVLLYVATSISELGELPKKNFKEILNKILFKFKKNSTSTQKTIDNWRTEISALFAFVQESGDNSKPGLMAKRLAENQYLDEFFNYFLYSFQYPGGHIKPRNVIKQIEAGVKFKPCWFILALLKEGNKLTKKSFSITAEELTHCAYFDLRVTKGEKSPRDVAKMLIKHREENITYDYKYEQLKNERTGKFPTRGDVNRYAGDILDYMSLASLLNHKGTGYYYYLNEESEDAISFHLKNSKWFGKYDKYYNNSEISISEISNLEEAWFSYVNLFRKFKSFEPKLDLIEVESISKLIEEYYQRITGKKRVPTKIIGDYGESLILAHEYLRTSKKSKRQHLINKIPTPLGVGYDIQSIEISHKKRYIEVKTTKSKKAIKNNRFKLTPNEWDTAETLGERYFIYYLVVNQKEKRIFIIQNPVRLIKDKKLKIDKNLVLEFKNHSGTWNTLLEIKN